MKKKIGILLLTLTCLLFGMGMTAYAADGEIQFSDLTVKSGEDVSMKVKMLPSNGGAIGDGTAELTYDPALLEFQSGTAESGANGSVTGGDGTVTIQASGTGTETELTFELSFKALAEGSAVVQATSSTAYMYSDEALNLTSGTGAVTIEAGDGTTAENTSVTVPSGDAITVQVNGTDYTLNEEFTVAVIPNGFEEATLNIQGSDHRVMYNAASGKYLGYLTDASGNSDYYLYNDAEGSFVFAELVDVSQVTSIVIFDPTDPSVLPTEYQETTSTINNKEFTAWHNTAEPDYFLVYALSSDGSEGYYQYDSIQQTYQRFTATAVSNEEDSETGIVAKLQNFVTDHLIMVLGIVAALLILMLIIIIVAVTKLRHRNEELDELYDELEYNGADSTDYEEDIEEDYEDDDFEDIEEDDFDEDDFDEDDFDEDDLDDEELAEADFDEDDFDEDDFDEDDFDEDDFNDEEDFDDEDFDDELDEEDLEEEDFEDEYQDEEDEEDRFLTKVIQKKKPVEDDFSIDFIDLDD